VWCEVTSKPLQEGAIYSMALTPHQYVARALPSTSRWRAARIAWVLVPHKLDEGSLLSGPILYVDTDGHIGVSGGLTEASVSDLDFTGRYADGNQR
jgi:hypothetical protein